MKRLWLTVFLTLILCLLFAGTVLADEVSGYIMWCDNENQDGYRPECVTVRLLADGMEVYSVSVTEADGWSYTFSGLPDGYAFSVTEEEVCQYTTEISGYDIINTHVTETTKVEGCIVWDDCDNQDGLRPDSVNVRLLADGAEMNAVTVTEYDGWRYSFTDIDRYRYGCEIAYTVTEDDVADYTSAVSGYDITNSHTTAAVSVSGSIVWDDGNNARGERPESVSVDLFGDGSYLYTVTATGADGWSYTFSDLSEYGSDVVFTVRAKGIENYTCASDGYNITLTHYTRSLQTAAAIASGTHLELEYNVTYFYSFEVESGFCYRFSTPYIPYYFNIDFYTADGSRIVKTKQYIVSGWETCTYWTINPDYDGAVYIAVRSSEECGCLSYDFTVEKTTLFEISADGVLLRYNGSAAGVAVPEGVVSIGDYAFWNNEALETVTLPAGVQSIGNTAFSQCKNLTSVSLPSGLQSIGIAAFNACPRLTSISLPSGLLRIGWSAFASSGLTSVAIPDTVTYIAGDAFEYSQLAEITISSSLLDSIDLYTTFCSTPWLENYIRENCDTDAEFVIFSGHLIAYNGSSDSVTVPGGVLYIESGAFGDVDTVVIPQGVQSIKNNAFGKVREITLPEDVSLDWQPFSGTEVLHAPESLFTYRNIRNVFCNLPAYIDRCIAGAAELGSTEHAAVPDETEKWYRYTAQQDGMYTFGISNGTAAACYDLYAPDRHRIGREEMCTEAELKVYMNAGETVYLAVNHFYDYNTGAVEADISVTRTAGSAFIINYEYGMLSGYRGVSSVITVPSGVTLIADGALSGRGLSRVNLPEGVEMIGCDAFVGNSSNLTVRIPPSVTYIDEKAFDRGLEKVTLEVDDESYAYEWAMEYGFDVTVFCTSANGTLSNYGGAGGDIYIPDNVSAISSGVFESYQRITSVTIPAGVSRISSRAFYGCQYLKVVTLLGADTEIADDAFEGCTAITAVNLPAGADYDSIAPYFRDSLWYRAYTLRSAPAITCGTVLELEEGVTYCYSMQAEKGFFYRLSAPENYYDFCIEFYRPDGSCMDVNVQHCYTDGNTEDALNFWVIEVDCDGPVYIVLRVDCADIRYEFKAEKTTLFEISADGVLVRYNGTENEVSVPEGVVSIGEYAFYKNYYIETVTLPAGVRSIGDSAFAWCWNLSSVSLPSGLQSIDSCAFSYCYELASIGLPSGLQSIGRSAFVSARLGSVVIPDTVTRIDDYAFSGTWLEEVTIDSGLLDCIDVYNVFEGTFWLDEYINENIDRDAEFVIVSGHLIAYNGSSSSIMVPNGVRYIECGAFGDVDTVVIPQGVKSLAYHAFEKVREITLPEGIYLSFEAFTGTQVLHAPASVFTYQNICNTLCDLPGYIECRFRSAAELGSTEHAEVPDRTEKWYRYTAQQDGMYTFSISSDAKATYEMYAASQRNMGRAELCTDAEFSMYIEMGEIVYLAVNHVNELPALAVEADISVTRTDGSAFIVDANGVLTGYLGVSNAVSVPRGVTAIGRSALSNMSLVNVSLPDGLESIDSYAFSGNGSNLTVWIPSSVTSINRYAFGSSDKTATLEVLDGSYAHVWAVQHGFNTVIYAHRTASVTAVWDDGDDRDGLRPSSISIKLTLGVQSMEYYCITAAENWSASADFVTPASMLEAELTAECGEIPGYTAVYDGEKGIITLSHEAVTTAFTVGVEWDDGDNRNYVRPESVSVTISGSDGSEYPLTVSGDTWSAEAEVKAYMNGGEPVTFTVSAERPACYNVSVSGSAVICSYTEANTLTMPAALTTVGRYAFSGCSAERIIVGSKVQRIYIGAFADCPNLRFVVIPASVTSISSYAFKGSSGVRCLVTAGSYAESFCIANGIDYTVIG